MFYFLLFEGPHRNARSSDDKVRSIWRRCHASDNANLGDVSKAHQDDGIVGLTFPKLRLLWCQNRDWLDGCRIGLNPLSRRYFRSGGDRQGDRGRCTRGLLLVVRSNHRICHHGLFWFGSRRFLRRTGSNSGASGGFLARDFRA